MAGVPSRVLPRSSSAAWALMTSPWPVVHFSEWSGQKWDSFSALEFQSEWLTSVRDPFG